MIREHLSPIEITNSTVRFLWLLYIAFVLSGGQFSEADPHQYINSPELSLAAAAPHIIAELCREVRLENSIERTPDTLLITEIEAAISTLAELKLPPQILSTMEGYVGSIKTLESEGRLQLVSDPFAKTRANSSRKKYQDGVRTCSVATIRTLEGRDAKEVGYAFHESMHAVIFAMEAEGWTPIPYEVEEEHASFYDQLVQYGSRLHGNADLQQNEDRNTFGIDLPLAHFHLANMGFNAGHPVYKYLTDRMIDYSSIRILKDYEQVSESNEQLLKELQNPLSLAMIRESQEGIHKNTQRLLEDERYLEKWIGYEWSPQALAAMQSLTENGITQEDFFKLSWDMVKKR